MPVATRRGGAEATLLDVLRHGQDDARWLVAFLEDGPMVQEVESLEADVAVIGAGRLRDARRLLAATRRIGAIVRSWGPDVVLSWMSKAHLYAAPAATILKVPALWFQHGLPRANDPIDRLATLASAGAVLAPSETVAAAQAALWPHRRTRVIYPGIDTNGAGLASNVQKDALLAGVGVPKDATVIGIVGRLQRWKGMHVLIEALPEIVAARPDAHVVIVGGDHPLEPGYRGHLQRLSHARGVADRVHIAGYRADALSWMAAFDVVVHASDNEPFGLVVLEAMALGKPLVAGAAGGPAEVIRDGVEGFLVPYEDARGLADRVVRYLEDPELSARLGGSPATSWRSCVRT
jgi:glycosyltransferase involved in cell wall biosynthesis